MRLVLASASPRRAELLRAAGFTFEVCPADVDETPRAGEPADAFVRRLSAEKAAWAAARLAPAEADGTCEPAFLGADTVVVVDGAIFGKPRDDDDARRMLTLVSGRAHEVLTGVTLRRGDAAESRVVTTRVVFSALAPDELDWYVASGEGRDKAGAYAVQGLASRFVAQIEGSYSNVVGLPVATVHALWRQLASRG